MWVVGMMKFGTTSKRCGPAVPSGRSRTVVWRGTWVLGAVCGVRVSSTRLCCEWPLVAGVPRNAGPPSQPTRARSQGSAPWATRAFGRQVADSPELADHLLRAKLLRIPTPD